MAVGRVPKQVMPVRILAKFLPFIFAAALAGECRADFLLCKSSEGASASRKSRSVELLKFLDSRNPGGIALTVVMRDEPNAYAVTNSEIILTTGLLENLRSTDEEAFVLAHELGHLSSGGAGIYTLVSGSDSGRSELAEEEHADRYAVNLVNLKGFDRSAGISLLARMEPLLTSPTLPAREEALERLLAVQPRVKP